MNIKDIKKDMFVEDKWFWYWGIGKVSKVLKTVVYIDFSIKGNICFDASHCQFLKRF